ncbi:hypothetical protein BU24DRAFT_408318 [Aaosphaeria arxii CBS 175.79]|uniref:Xaa-Pro aminopeptidase n=1 Tax=Aaosphaeria arxii CBS 175.79 TaxID=1450172 RepID=A0A6A5XZM2_9PLEO|nr:uncharacterized protein BU24DRAFT_408318 [Aaosphaeria arxii CBS 175.79]KAF2018406.1 hypothetical protein BU24DRAFT_408318 [Aaosphaeria arxii CBS 175.79]
MVAEDYEKILKGKYTAKKHVQNVVNLIRDSEPDVRGLIYIEGSKTRFLEESDLEETFRQRRNFYYLTGCNLKNCSFIFDIQSCQSTLLIPAADPEEIIWSGVPLSIQEALDRYDVDHVLYTSETETLLEHLIAKYPESTLYTLPSPAFKLGSKDSFRQDDSLLLKNAIEAARVIKDEYEVAMIRKANYISSMAHLEVMKRVRTLSSELEIEAGFVANCTVKGSRTPAYPSVVGSGRAGAILHYEDNNASLEGKLNVLHDAGTEWECYASDITRTFPISGKFSPESKAIYELVLKMQKDCMAMIKPGANWDDIHIQAHKIAIDGLLEFGIMKGDREEIFASQTSLAFFPHGLGHYLGLDVHDVGGKSNDRDENGMMRYLRKRGPLPTGSVVTVEPGIYFCKEIILPHLESEKHQRFIDEDVLNRYWEVGGVRIEDNVLVTDDGYENLTMVMKEVSEIEALVR